MSFERLQAALQRFDAEVRGAHADGRTAWGLDGQLSRKLLESMLLARQLDWLAHELRQAGKGHYTICSAGHEANVVLGHLTRSDDPTLLHYRSAAVQIERARQAPEIDAVRDIALSLAAAASEPLCAGRHKAFGSRTLGIIPQTSTIASHLPRAVGLAFGLERLRRLGLSSPYPADALVLASFGDASLNHSTAQGALNAASWVIHQNMRLPLLLVCEDNGLGISVRTPPDWIETRLRAQPHFRYFCAASWQLDQVFRAANEAVEFCRQRRLPAVLHLHCQRLLGHAGSDVDTSYRTREELEAASDHDPLLQAALRCIRAGVLESSEVLALAEACRERVVRAGEQARNSPGLTTREEVMQALVPPRTEPPTPGASQTPAANAPASDSASEPCTLAQGINMALRRLLSELPGSLLFGEDVAKKGGVYGVTKGLLSLAGPARVFNTLLDEQTILGLALGTATLGLFPIAEIQYLAYLHNAEDQLRGEAATLRFFSNGAYDNPMLVRVAGLAYQKGFGGHFHNDNSLAVLRDIPGIVVAVPARADDAEALYREAAQVALGQRQVVVVIEPIALYHERHLEDGDQGWLSSAEGQSARLGEPRVYAPDATDLLMVSYGNGLRACLRVSRRLERQLGVRCRVLDLRWLKPLPIEAVARHAAEIGRTLVVDECRTTGSVSEEILAELCDRSLGTHVGRVTSADCFIPLGEAANLVLLQEAEIADAAQRLLSGQTTG